MKAQYENPPAVLIPDYIENVKKTLEPHMKPITLPTTEEKEQVCQKLSRVTSSLFFFSPFLRSFYSYLLALITKTALSNVGENISADTRRQNDVVATSF